MLSCVARNEVFSAEKNSLHLIGLYPHHIALSTALPASEKAADGEYDDYA